MEDGCVKIEKNASEAANMEILLGKKPNFYKANLHCHTTLSDGKCTPKEIKKRYTAQGYSAVAFTDHEHLIEHTDLTDENFVAITGAELAIKEFPTVSTLVNRRMKVTHLNIYAKDPYNVVTPCYSSLQDHYVNDENRHLVHHEGEYERVYSPEGINEIIKNVREHGFLVAYNHPSWSLETARDYLEYDNLDFVEIYNTGCVRAGHPDDEHVFFEMTMAGKKIFCTAADDNHNVNPFDSPRTDSFGGWVMINAEKLEYGELMDALERGDFYASSGPEIYSLEKDGETVRVKCSPAVKINLITASRRHKRVMAQTDERICEAEFVVDESDSLFRIRVTDENGNHAYTQYYSAKA